MINYSYICAFTMLLLCNASVLAQGPQPGGHPEFKSVGSNGIINFSYLITEKFEIESVTFTYLSGENNHQTKTESITVAISEALNLEGTFSQATGLDYSRVQTHVINRKWRVVSREQLPTRDTTSTMYWSANKPKSPWKFASWTIGPPPTEANQGGLTTTAPQVAGTTRWFTENQRQSWALEWVESKSE